MRPARRRLATLLLTAAALTAAPASAQVRVETSLDTTRVTVGDRVHLRVTVEHPEGTRVAWPDSLPVAPFEVLDLSISGPEAADPGMRRSRLQATLTVFELGSVELPSWPIEVVGPDGAVVERAATDAFTVEVVRVSPEGEAELRDIKEPLSVPPDAVTVLAWLLGILVVVAAALWLARRLRREDADAGPELTEPLRPPHEVALEALAELERSGLLERGEVKEFHVRLSGIVRRYVEDGLGVDALEMTTREVLDGLARAGAPDALREELRRVLEACDLVKFARVRPGPEASLALVASARRVVEAGARWRASRQAEEAAEASEAAEAAEAEEAPEGTDAAAVPEAGDADAPR